MELADTNEVLGEQTVQNQVSIFVNNFFLHIMALSLKIHRWALVIHPSIFEIL